MSNLTKEEIVSKGGKGIKRPRSYDEDAKDLESPKKVKVTPKDTVKKISVRNALSDAMKFAATAATLAEIALNGSGSLRKKTFDTTIQLNKAVMKIISQVLKQTK